MKNWLKNLTETEVYKKILENKKWLILGILLIGLGITVYLVQTEKRVKSRAAGEISPQTFSVTETKPDGSESPINFDYSDSSYHVTSLHVKVKIEDLQDLIQ